MNFLEILKTQNKNQVKKYDFDMKYWPVDFCANSVEKKDTVVLPNFPDQNKPYNPFYDFLCSGIGRWLIMPGSLSFVNNQVDFHLNNFRQKFIEKYGAERVKIKLHDDAFIDSIYRVVLDRCAIDRDPSRGTSPKPQNRFFRRFYHF